MFIYRPTIVKISISIYSKQSFILFYNFLVDKFFFSSHLIRTVCSTYFLKFSRISLFKKLIYSIYTKTERKYYQELYFLFFFFYILFICTVIYIYRMYQANLKKSVVFVVFCLFRQKKIKNKTTIEKYIYV